MAATRTQIYLTVEQRRRLDALRAERGETLAALIREAVDSYLEGSSDRNSEEALAETFGAAPGFEVPSRAEWATREWRNTSAPPTKQTR